MEWLLIFGALFAVGGLLGAVTAVRSWALIAGAAAVALALWLTVMIAGRGDESDVDETSWAILYAVLLGAFVVVSALGVAAGRWLRRTR
jgi:hypothetical protein